MGALDKPSVIGTRRKSAWSHVASGLASRPDSPNPALDTNAQLHGSVPSDRCIHSSGIGPMRARPPMGEVES